jgi:hypothetical protein
VLQHPQFTLTILDPTSLAGSLLIGTLGDAFPAARRRLFHTTGTTDHLIADVGSEPALVPPLADGGELDGTDIVVATAPPAPAAAALLLAWLRAHPAVVLIDCTQPGLAPAESLPVLAAPPPGSSDHRWFHLADPALWAPGCVLRALAALAPTDAVLTLLLPASDFGDPGIEELAKQGAARLSGRPAERSVTLPGILAFDALPAFGARFTALRQQLRNLFPGVACRLAAAHVGVFHGHAAALAVHLGGEADAAHVAEAIRSAPGLRIARRSDRPHLTVAVDGDEIVCAEIEYEGGWVSAWLFADAVRVGAPQVVADIVASVRAS